MLATTTRYHTFLRILLQPSNKSLLRRLNSNGPQDDETSNSASIKVKPNPRDILAREFPTYYSNGKFSRRASYVEFIDEALARAVELGVHKDPEYYKELLRVFPPGRFWPGHRTFLEGGMFHAPQQLAAHRVLMQMSLNGLKPDKDFEKIIVDAFSKRSDTWIQITMLNYWTMKGRNLDPNPLPETLPEQAHDLAKLGISRMIEDPQALVTVTNTSNVPNCVDKTWLVYSQSPVQKTIIDKLDEKSVLYIEEGGLTFVGDAYLSYFVLKYYVDEKTRAEKALDLKPKPDHNYNTVKMSFYGKPIRKKLTSSEDKHYMDGYYILSIAATGTSSQDSLLSWLKILQQRNPNLGKLNVVFRMNRPSPELIQCDKKSDEREEHEQSVS